MSRDTRTMQLPTVAHLMHPLQHCTRCGHASLLHWHTGGVCDSDDCTCSIDPTCTRCGELASWHELPESMG